MEEKQIGLPHAVFYYTIFKTLPLVLLFLLISSNLIDDSLTSLLSLIIFTAGPFYLYVFIKIKSISWIVDENKITINSGIITKESTSIPLINIQNANLNRGPFCSLFNLSNLNIWTASPNQIHTERGNSTSSPSASLFLLTPDAEWLKNFLLTPHQSAPIKVQIQQPTQSIPVQQIIPPTLAQETPVQQPETYT